MPANNWAPEREKESPRSGEGGRFNGEQGSSVQKMKNDVLRRREGRGGRIDEVEKKQKQKKRTKPSGKT